MRTFWIVVVVALLAGGAWVLMPSGGSGADGSGLHNSGAATMDRELAASGGAEPSAVAADPGGSAETAPADVAQDADAVALVAEPEAAVAAVDAIEVPETTDSTEAVEPVEVTASVDDVVESVGAVEAGDTSVAAEEADASVNVAGGFGSLVFDPAALGLSEPDGGAGAVDAEASGETSGGASLDAASMDEAAAALAGLIESFGAAIGSGTGDEAGRESEAGGTSDLPATGGVDETTDVRTVEADPAAEVETSMALDAVAEHPDGGLEIGGRWRVPGSGTSDDPYVVRWDILQSAMQIYNPRIGKTEPPAWASAFNGKRVAIEGYVVLPLAQQASTEILLTLNQWDGCCIGVPPTPYDAIEVTLNDPIDGNAAIGAFYYGQLEGTFSVDPYLAGGWLLGLYLMEDAVLTSFDAK
ncbi:MAG: hypothetical protein AAF297_12485 [Planctomycetota bacterium]